jgi:glycosyltransferase involved in cell wall biosynthesis
VATRVGAVPDLVVDGQTGHIVPPGDEEALAAALRGVLAAAPAQRARWGAAGRARCEAVYGYRQWVAAHESLYAQVLAEHPGLARGTSGL